MQLSADAMQHYNAGVFFQENLQWQEAAQHFREAVRLEPRFVEAHNNLGNSLRQLDQLDSAADALLAALALRPDFADAHCNLGAVYQDQARFVDAASCYRRTLVLDPNMAEAHWLQATLRLLQGDYTRGLPEFEWRVDCPGMRHVQFRQPPWNRESLDGRTILLYTEQGLGDGLQFIRYANVLKQKGARVVICCELPLLPLLQNSFPTIALVPEGSPLPHFDYHASVMSLPYLCRTSLNTIPSDVPYLFPAPVLSAEWGHRLTCNGAFRIGINWRGREGIGLFRRRNIPAKMFSALGQIPGIRLINLQKDAKPSEFTGQDSSEWADIQGVVVHLGDSVDAVAGAFMDTAAIMRNLDLVITSDTAIAHLAGGLGVPVWVALPFVPDWRWLLDRSDSPWYPTMRLFRQKSPGDWAEVFGEIEAALKERLSGS